MSSKRSCGVGSGSRPLDQWSLFAMICCSAVAAHAMATRIFTNSSVRCSLLILTRCDCSRSLWKDFNQYVSNMISCSHFCKAVSRRGNSRFVFWRANWKTARKTSRNQEVQKCGHETIFEILVDFVTRLRITVRTVFLYHWGAVLLQILLYVSFYRRFPEIGNSWENFRICRPLTFKTY